MLKKRHKLPVREYVRRGGRATHTAYFSLRVFPAAAPHARVGVIVSSRTAKGATERNRMKRLVFDFFRLRREELPGADFLITVRPPAAILSNAQLVRELAAIVGIPPVATSQGH